MVKIANLFLFTARGKLDFSVPVTVNVQHYHMAVPHKDLEIPNSRIWLAEIDIESGLGIPI